MAGLIAGLAGLVAAGVALGGSFLTIHEVDRGGSVVYRQTWWGLEQDTEIGTTYAFAGLALVLAALLLGVGAVLAFTRYLPAARLLLALGLGTLTGTVLLQAMLTVQDMAVWDKIPLSEGETQTFTAEWGLFLPIGGVLFGIVAVVCAQQAPTARLEPNTPRMGFPMPYGPGPMTGAQPVIPGAGVAAGVPAGVAAGAASGMPAGVAAAGGVPAVPPGATPAAPTAPAGTTPPAAAPTGAVHTPAAAPAAAGAGAAAAALAQNAPTTAAPSTSDDAEITQRTTVDADAPAATPAATAAVPAPPAAAEIASALTPPGATPAATDEPEPHSDTAWAVSAEPASEAPTESAVAEAAEPPAAPGPEATDAAAEESAEATPEAAEPTEESAAATQDASETASEARPEPGASGLGDLPAAPPAPELADETDTK